MDVAQMVRFIGPSGHWFNPYIPLWHLVNEKIPMNYKIGFETQDIVLVVLTTYH